MKNQFRILFLTLLFIANTVVFAANNGIAIASSNKSMLSGPADILASVQVKISQDKRLADYNILPTSHGSVVTLNGTVDTKEQETAAISDAKSVTGVSDVKSNMIITDPN